MPARCWSWGVHTPPDIKALRRLASRAGLRSKAAQVAWMSLVACAPAREERLALAVLRAAR
eukprot:4517794-Alexandrium_andersonii.AAC.1